MVAVELARSIGADTRTQSYKRRRLWAVKHKNGGKFPVFAKVEKPVEKEVTGRFYPGDDVKKPLNKRVIRRPTRLRASISPGTVLILLAGRFKGKRVVFLKQLPSGLLLVSGPFKVNGVPSRRVNQAYVIATSTKVKLPADLDTTKFDDAFFKCVEKAVVKKDEMFTEEENKAKELTAAYLEAQKALDSKLVKALSPELKGYLGTRFSLNQGDRPHLMKF
jgi:large subunit ribosomal protein L6e